MEFIAAHKLEIIMALLAVSEVLGSMDFFRSSSIFQLVVNSLKSLKGLFLPKQV